MDQEGQIHENSQIALEATSHHEHVCQSRSRWTRRQDGKDQNNVYVLSIFTATMWREQHSPPEAMTYAKQRPASHEQQGKDHV